MIWIALLIVFGAGLVGGALNALMSDNGFLLPKYDRTVDPPLLRPGYLGNMLIGGVAAAISWGLYGPASSVSLLPAEPQARATEPAPGGTPLTVAGLVGGILVGVTGARWLSNEVDKNLLRAAASQAALGKKNDALATRLVLATPAAALQEAAREAAAP